MHLVFNHSSKKQSKADYFGSFQVKFPCLSLDENEMKPLICVVVLTGVYHLLIDGTTPPLRNCPLRFHLINDIKCS